MKIKIRPSYGVVAVIGLFAIIGVALIMTGRAATMMAHQEAEVGSLSGAASVTRDADASAGAAVAFGVQPGGKPTFGFRMFGGADDPARIGTANMKRYDVYLLSPYMVQIAKVVKQQNPSAKTFMYKDPTSTRTTGACVPDAAGLDWGVDYCDADKSHASWFMTKGGQRFQYAGYSGHWHLDVGASGYKEAYAANVLADLKRNQAWDGVFMDNIMADIRAYVPGGVFPDQYKDQASAQNAYASFTDYVGKTLSAAGFGSMGNNNGARLVPGLWNKYTAGTTGGYDEFWTTFGDANLPLYDGVGWEAQMAEVDSMISRGKLGVFTAQTKDGSCKTCQSYGYASYLLANDGTQTYVEGNVDTQTGGWINNAAMYSWDLGTPQAARSQPQTNLFQRQYSKGLVFVNADKSASRNVQLAKPYLDMSGKSVTSITVGPLSGVILRQP